MATQPNHGRDIETDLVDVISDPIHDAGLGLGSGRDAARAVLRVLSIPRNRRKLRAWLDEADAEVTLLRSILARLHETGPAGRPWGEIVNNTLHVDEQEHGEGVRFDLTPGEVAAFNRARGLVRRAEG